MGFICLYLSFLTDNLDSLIINNDNHFCTVHDFLNYFLYLTNFQSILFWVLCPDTLTVPLIYRTCIFSFFTIIPHPPSFYIKLPGNNQHLLTPSSVLLTLFFLNIWTTNTSLIGNLKKVGLSLISFHQSLRPTYFPFFCKILLDGQSSLPPPFTQYPLNHQRSHLNHW